VPPEFSEEIPAGLFIWREFFYLLTKLKAIFTAALYNSAICFMRERMVGTLD
jgi:hypothetical protein